MKLTNPPAQTTHKPLLSLVDRYKIRKMIERLENEGQKRRATTISRTETT